MKVVQYFIVGGGATGAATASWAPIAVSGVLLIAALTVGTALVTALAWLVAALAALMVALIAGVLVLRRRAEAWKPFGADSRISTGPRTTAGHQCAVCAPVYIPASALVAGPDGRLLGLCRTHKAAADLILRRALPAGGQR